jgi:hypothetical protein
MATLAGNWMQPVHPRPTSIRPPNDGNVEDPVSTENWVEERDRLVKLLEAIEAGHITHVDQAGTGQLRPTNDINVAALRARLAKLNTRLSEG